MPNLRHLLLCALVVLLASGCARPVERQAERRINALLPEYVGPAQKYSSRVRGDVGALARGRARHVHVDGVQVRLDEALTVDTLALDLGDVEVDTKAGRLRAIRSIAFSATLREANLNRYVRARRAEIPDLQVELRPAGALVRARPEVLGAGVPIQVEGTITPRAGGRLLDFSPGAARVSVVPVPASVLQYLARELNPIVDLSTLRVPVRVARTRTEQGVLILEGDVDPADLLRAAGGGASAP